MVLNEIGKITEKYWLEIPDHFSFVIWDEFVVMLNHVHGILVINKNRNNGRDIAMNNGREVAMQRLYIGDNLNMSKISPKKYSLSSIIRSYKSICTKIINKIQNKIFFTWKPKFHDHIIRNKHELKRIRKYIKYNHLKWQNNDYYIFKKML